jgi:hypothetical protein
VVQLPRSEGRSSILRSKNAPTPKRTRKSADKLTAHQLRVFREVEEIAYMIKLNYPYILAYKRDARTLILEHMRRKMILSEIITRDTLLDEHLNLAKMPKGVVGDIERLNALRNGLAHAFFPENLKRSEPEWKVAS